MSRQQPNEQADTGEDDDPRNYEVLNALSLEQLQFLVSRSRYKIQGYRKMNKQELIEAWKALCKARDKIAREKALKRKRTTSNVKKKAEEACPKSRDEQ